MHEAEWDRIRRIEDRWEKSMKIEYSDVLWLIDQTHNWLQHQPRLAEGEEEL